MVPAVFAMLVSLATGWAALACVWPRRRDGGGDLVLRSTIAIGIGFFLNSVIYLFCLGLHVAERPWVISLDLAGLAGLAYVARRVRRRAKLLDANEGDLELNAPAGNFEWVLGSGLVVALLTATLTIRGIHQIVN